MALAASVGFSGSIHGLMAYVTAKCSGGHIRYPRAEACRGRGPSALFPLVIMTAF
jgi:hypothetical protein